MQCTLVYMYAHFMHACTFVFDVFRCDNKNGEGIVHQNEVQFLKIALRYPKQLAVRYVIQHELTNKHALTCTRVIPPPQCGHEQEQCQSP